MDKHDVSLDRNRFGRMVRALEAMFYNGYEVLLESMEEDEQGDYDTYLEKETPLFEGVTDLLNLVNEVVHDKRIDKMIEEAQGIHDQGPQIHGPHVYPVFIEEGFHTEQVIEELLKVPEIQEASLLAWSRRPPPDGVNLDAGLDAHQDDEGNGFPDPLCLSRDYLYYAAGIWS